MTHFRVHMLPAAHGDCLWVEYGDSGQTHRLIIDGGVAPTYPKLRERIASLPPPERDFELLVITHVDADHIEGIVTLLADPTHGARFHDVWFNAYEHLREGMPLDFGALQGEFLSALIQKQDRPWNAARGGKALVVPDEGPLPTFTLPGGLVLTLLSPSYRTMRKMAGAWEDECRKAGLDPAHPAEALDHLMEKAKRLLPHFGADTGPDVESLAAEKYVADTSPANGSSIAFLAEYGGKRCLFGADAHSEVLLSSVKRLLAAEGRDVLELDAFKLPHHGSRANLSKELLALVKPRSVLVSTNGARFHHPDEEAIARVLSQRWGASLYFNYRSKENKVWDNAVLMKEYGYEAHFPDGEKDGMTVEI